MAHLCIVSFHLIFIVFHILCPYQVQPYNIFCTYASQKLWLEKSSPLSTKYALNQQRHCINMHSCRSNCQAPNYGAIRSVHVFSLWYCVCHPFAAPDCNGVSLINLQVAIIKAPLFCVFVCVHHHHSPSHMITVSSSSMDVDREKKGLTGGVLSLALWR